MKLREISALHRYPLFKEAYVKLARPPQDPLALKLGGNPEEYAEVIDIVKGGVHAIAALYNDHSVPFYLAAAHKSMLSAIVSAIREAITPRDRQGYLFQKTLIVNISAHLCKSLCCALRLTQKEVVGMYDLGRKTLCKRGGECSLTRAARTVYGNYHPSPFGSQHLYRRDEIFYLSHIRRRQPSPRHRPG